METLNLPKPQTNEQEILLTLIKFGNTSIIDFPYLSGFRTRISELQLKHGLYLDRKMECRMNKFGNKYNYSIHILPESEKEKAIDIYYKIIKN